MNQPRYARLEAIEYRDARPNIAKDTSVLRVHYTVNSNHYQFPVSNVEWSKGCEALQLLALYGYKPTDLAVYTDIEEPRFFAVTQDPNGDWLPVQGWLDGGRAALEDAEWFDPSLGANGADSDSDGFDGGGGPDPSTGNRGGVDYDDADDESGVTTELTPNENTGVNVTVE